MEFLSYGEISQVKFTKARIHEKGTIPKTYTKRPFFRDENFLAGRLQVWHKKALEYLTLGVNESAC